MRFGGHESFPVRETWLSKGLILLHEDPSAFEDSLIADRLGVGANMAKSIRHWLRLTRLADGAGKGGLTLTELGKLVLAYDRAMLLPATWWALHVNVCSQNGEAIAWHWLFSRFQNDHRFDRVQCVEALTKQVASEGQRMPSPRTVVDDISCLLASYARPLPPPPDDPEDATDCPFRQLGLLVHYRESDTYRFTRGPKAIPPEILCYALAAAFREERATVAEIDVPVREALARPGGPGRVLALSAEAFAEALSDAERLLGPKRLRSEMVGGDRVIRLAPLTTIEWLIEHYRSAAG
ncbi:DUF4007 family protein [Azospirillum sp. TSA2s]|uniref:DUF4007 family protein n=1 Tax=Azospirillum sp. TSA2s TaxID=709810 RepID=UPI00145AD42F|nr:DUF4007 family protein [Azospirillum sp. TSA2s]